MSYQIPEYDKLSGEKKQAIQTEMRALRERCSNMNITDMNSPEWRGIVKIINENGPVLLKIISNAGIKYMSKLADCRLRQIS